MRPAARASTATPTIALHCSRWPGPSTSTTLAFRPCSATHRSPKPARCCARWCRNWTLTPSALCQPHGPCTKGCGAPAPKDLENGGSLVAQVALRQVLHRGTLDVVAQGPLSNVAALLAREPALARRITRVIAVMGRRPGHRFHPSENRASGSGSAMLFGHGPIFRDLNAVLDPQAVSVVLASGIPLTLVPYSAARQVLLSGADLDRIALTGAAGRWATERSREWLGFWHSKAGLEGFYPFDLMAAAYVRDPAKFRCARVVAWVDDDALLPWFGGGPALLVAQATGPPASSTGTAPAPAPVLYCDVVRVQVDDMFLSLGPALGSDSTGRRTKHRM